MLLLNKELRIQTMTCVVAGLFVAVWLATSAADSMSPLWVPPSTIYVVASLYQGLVALMTGALAIAEERRFGTVDWQALLPWPVWKQWAVKIGITVSLALVLAVVVPRVLATMLPSPWNLDYDIVAILMPCIAALYVSSLSRTGFRAFLATLPFIGVASLLGVLIVDPLSQYSREAFGPLATQLQAFIRFDRADFHWLTGSAGGSLVGGFALLMLRFAYVNYRHGDLNRPRVARQVLWMSAYAVGGLLLASLVGAMFLVFLAQSG